MSLNETRKKIIEKMYGQYNTIVLFDNETESRIPISYRKEHENKLFIDLSTSSVFKPDVMEFYGVEKLPCAVVSKKVVYFDQIEVLNQKVKTITKQAKVFIFIKGTVAEPKCKFTRELLCIFKECGLEYEKDFLEFNILENEEMRSGLKEINNWPTFPQIYIKQQFLGGIDVLKKIVENGELRIRIK